MIYPELTGSKTPLQEFEVKTRIKSGGHLPENPRLIL